MKSGDNGVSVHLSHVLRSIPTFRPTGPAAGGRPTKEFGKVYGYGTGVETYNAATRSTDGTLCAAAAAISRSTPPGQRQPDAPAEARIWIGDKDSVVPPGK